MKFKEIDNPPGQHFELPVQRSELCPKDTQRACAERGGEATAGGPLNRGPSLACVSNDASILELPRASAYTWLSDPDMHPRARHGLQIDLEQLRPLVSLFTNEVYLRHTLRRFRLWVIAAEVPTVGYTYRKSGALTLAIVLIGLWLSSSTAFSQINSNGARQAVSELPAAVDNAPGKLFRDIQGELFTRLDALLSNPAEYQRRVESECRFLPESDLVPHAFLAYAYTNWALKHPERQPVARKRIAQLVDIMIPTVARTVEAPDGRLMQLKRFNGHGVYLGHLNLALGCFRLIGGDARYEELHRHLSNVLLDEFIRQKGRPLLSYPDRSWPFDTIPSLVSLRLIDWPAREKEVEAAIRSHLEWIANSGTDPETKLPYSDLGCEPTGTKVGPRGGDLALRIALIAHLDEAFAQKLYKQYVELFWKEYGFVAGFAEWPNGGFEFEDADSGPVIFGLGTAATGLGIGTTIAMSDQQRMERYAAMLGSHRSIIAALNKRVPPESQTTNQNPKWGWIELTDKDWTGFLFGDICLYYVVGWERWGAH